MSNSSATHAPRRIAETRHMCVYVFDGGAIELATPVRSMCRTAGVEFCTAVFLPHTTERTTPVQLKKSLLLPCIPNINAEYVCCFFFFLSSLAHRSHHVSICKNSFTPPVSVTHVRLEMSYQKTLYAKCDTLSAL